MEDRIILSPLGHTWILDLDGTIVEHNGYKDHYGDRFIEGAKEFLNRIPKKDMIIFLTSRSDDCRDSTQEFLEHNGIRYDHIIFNAPYGERILLNDNKPSGLKMGIAVNKKRNTKKFINYRIDKSL